MASEAVGGQALAGTPALVVLDERGELFALIRGLELGVAIWRTRQAPAHSGSLDPATLLVLAVYEQPDWPRVHDIARRFMTIVAMHPATSENALRALRAGAVGLLDSGMARDVMRRTLLGALRGEPVYGRDVLGAWLRNGQAARAASSRDAGGLTARQREIVDLIARGATDREIATALGIRTATAQKHVANLLRRLGVPNRAAAVGLLWKESGQGRV
ncbi:MAG: response regulator transcription factor [Candidatus Limnocylindria bacterium]